MAFLTFGMSTQCKNKKHVNQDRFGSVTVKNPYAQEILIAAISDGVTMCHKGEVAAYNTIRFILNWAAEYFSINEFDSETIATEFDELITSINQNLNHYSLSQDEKSPQEGYSPYSTCTLCCVMTDGEKLLYFIVGDSSIYELKKYSTIHITAGGKHKNEKGQLTSHIGGIDDSRLDIRYIESHFDNSSAYLLCSDGMCNKIDFNVETNEDFRAFNQRLLSANSRNYGVNALAAMTEYVIARGENDDITALVVKGIKG